MRDLMVICLDGHRNAIISSVFVAMHAKQAGQDVALFFVQGPLATLADRKFEWSEELKPYAETIEHNMKEKGIPTDPVELLKIAKGLGIPLLACGAWTGFLGVEDKLPPELTVEDMQTCAKETVEAKKTITIA